MITILLAIPQKLLKIETAFVASPLGFYADTLPVCRGKTRPPSPSFAFLPPCSGGESAPRGCLSRGGRVTRRSDAASRTGRPGLVAAGLCCSPQRPLPHSNASRSGARTITNDGSIRGGGHPAILQSARWAPPGSAWRPSRCACVVHVCRAGRERETDRQTDRQRRGGGRESDCTTLNINDVSISHICLEQVAGSISILSEIKYNFLMEKHKQKGVSRSPQDSFQGQTWRGVPAWAEDCTINTRFITAELEAGHSALQQLGTVRGNLIFSGRREAFCSRLGSH